MLLLLCFYGLFEYCFTYTEDAYVKVNTLSVAAETEGRVTAVYIKDNDSVTVGEPLIQIDPTTLGLSRAITERELKETQDSLPVLRSQMNEMTANIASQQARLQFLKTTEGRYQSLFSSGALPKQTLDDIHSQVNVTEAELRRAKAMLVTAQRLYEKQQTSVELIRSKLQLSDYTLSQTKIIANQSGTVTSLNTYVGDYLKVGEPLFTIVSNEDWRVIANIKESHLQKIRVGQAAWVYLSSHPFTLYRARIQSIGRGVARDQNKPGALQYIDPSIDWIRYDYRFPVTLILVHPPQDLYMGSDARVWITR